MLLCACRRTMRGDDGCVVSLETALGAESAAAPLASSSSCCSCGTVVVVLLLSGGSVQFGFSEWRGSQRQDGHQYVRVGATLLLLGRYFG
jgi:hypothetical protein